jgi:hypothetical protein
MKKFKIKVPLLASKGTFILSKISTFLSKKDVALQA